MNLDTPASVIPATTAPRGNCYIVINVIISYICIYYT